MPRSARISAPSGRAGRSEGISEAADASIHLPFPGWHLTMGAGGCRDSIPASQFDDRHERTGCGRNYSEPGVANPGWRERLHSPAISCFRYRPDFRFTQRLRNPDWRNPDHFAKCSNFEQSLPKMVTRRKKWSTSAGSDWPKGLVWWSKSREEPWRAQAASTRQSRSNFFSRHRSGYEAGFFVDFKNDAKIVFVRDADGG